MHPGWVMINCETATTSPGAGMTAHLSLEGLSSASGDGRSFFRKRLDFCDSGRAGLPNDKSVASF